MITITALILFVVLVILLLLLGVCLVAAANVAD